MAVSFRSETGDVKKESEMLVRYYISSADLTAEKFAAAIKHIAINILTENKEFKAGLTRKMRRAAMNREYLASVLARGFRSLALSS